MTVKSTEDTRRFSIEAADHILRESNVRVTVEELIRTADKIDTYISSGVLPALPGTKSEKAASD